MNNKITLTLLLGMSIACSSAFGQNQKLIAKTHATYRNSGSYTEDSTHFFHSGTKANTLFKFNIPEFEYMADSMYMYQYNSTSKALELARRTIYTYNGSDFTESVTDSFSNGTWTNKLKVTMSYNGNKPDTVVYSTKGFGGNWVASYRYIYTWSGNKVATREKQNNVYDKKTKTWSWNNNSMLIYTYNGSNEISYIEQTYSGGSYVNSFKRETTYAAGKKTEQKTSNWGGSTWTDDTRDLYTYDGKSRLIKDYKEIYTSTWEPNRIDTFMFATGSSAVFPDTLLRISWGFGNFINDGKWAYNYLGDGTGRLTNQTAYSWNGTTAWEQKDGQDSLDAWYYGWNLSVNEVGAQANMIEVYPSPASNSINIKLDGIRDEQVHFAILDMQGKLMKNWMGKTQPVITMSIDELPAGNYLLHVQGDTQVATKRFAVVK